MSSLPDKEEMFRLVDLYPEVTEKKRKEIRKCIEESERVLLDMVMEQERMSSVHREWTGPGR